MEREDFYGGIFELVTGKVDDALARLMAKDRTPPEVALQDLENSLSWKQMSMLVVHRDSDLTLPNRIFIYPGYAPRPMEEVEKIMARAGLPYRLTERFEPRHQAYQRHIDSIPTPPRRS